MKKGFTLIELIAVILILGFIALITVPKALDVIEDSKKESVVNSAKVYVKAVNEAIINERMNKNKINDGTYSIASNGNICIGTLNVYQECTGDTWLNIDKKNSYPECGKITIEDGKVIASSELQYGNYSISREDQSSDYKIKKEDKCLRPTKESCFEYKSGITSYTCNEKNIILPKIISNDNHYKINAASFKNKGIESLIISKSVTEIGMAAFWENNISELVIPGNVKTIGDGAFRHNKISSLKIEDGVEYIGKSAFYENKLISVEIPSSVKTIGKSAFESYMRQPYNHNKIKTLILNEGLETIGIDAFRFNCLESVSLPNSLVYLSGFSNTCLSNVLIPSKVKTIGEYAFRDNALTQVNLPEGLEIIEYGAFENNKLSNITFPSTLKKLSGFINNTKITSIDIPNGVESIGEDAFRECSIVNLKIPNSVIEIDKYAFFKNKLEKLILGQNVEKIGNDSFSSNYLTNVEIPDSVTVIGEAAFKGNPLVSVTIGSGITSIQKEAFNAEGVSSPITITINRNYGDVTIGKNAFPIDSTVIYNDITITY